MQLRQLWLNWWWVVLSVPHDNKGDLSLTPQVWVDAFFSPYLWNASPHLRESKTFLYSGFHAADSRYCIPVFDSGTCILDSSRYWDSGLLELFSGFHKQNFPGLQIPQAKNFLDSGIRNPFFYISSVFQLFTSGVGTSKRRCGACLSTASSKVWREVQKRVW